MRLRRQFLALSMLLPLGAGLLPLSAGVLPLGAGLAQAAPAPYITPAQVDLTLLLPPPMPPGSPQDLAEQAEILAIQKSAAPERIKLAQHDVDETVYVMFGDVLGADFTPPRLGAADGFFTRVVESEDATVDPAKPFFKRVRPYLANPEIKALVTPTKSGSYPSGHTTRVTMTAIILAAMVPEKREAIWARAAEYAQSRVIGGMHYPNDLAAGRMAGVAIATAMLRDPGFQADFAAAKPLVRAALGLDR